MDLVRRQRVETLYVASLDRFSRRGPQHVGALLDEIDRAGGRVVFVWTASTPRRRPSGRPSQRSPIRLEPKQMPQH